MYLNRRYYVLRTAFLLFAVVTLHACANINHLREAQSTFNETAALENRLTLNLLDTSSGSISGAELETQIRAGYGSVLVSLQSAEDDQGRVLKENRLYGNMLMLRSMTYWRLRDTTNAAKVASSVDQLPDEQVFPRDRAMAVAMPGLIRNSQAHAILRQPLERPEHMKQDDFKELRNSAHREVKELLNAAIGIFDDAIERLSSQHGMLVYLHEAKLAVYKNLIDASAKFTQGKRLGAETVGKISAERDELGKSMCVVADVGTGKSLPSEDFARLVSWSLTLGLKVPDNKC